MTDTDLQHTVDIERLLSTFLRAQTTVTGIVDDRVYTVTPAEPTFPLVCLHLVDEQASQHGVLWHAEQLIQIDCYGGPKLVARQLVDAVRGAIAGSLVGAHDLGVVTQVTWSALNWLPDTDFDPAQPRYIVDVAIRSHP